MINLNTLWAFCVGGLFTAIVHKAAENDGKREGLEVGVNAGVAIGQELASQDIEVKPETKASDE